ncbi:MAG TPA: endonuclease/exonuclease/phosphatase family protein [Steroidobacteraceae bacterium]|jgi:endonuclease/exonuclease/phosphatase family metal-dependent hydrolase|nr:endonuclease/exonuclease/phosphatase family protein [Steroidobacteraceae bacterium]
MPGPRLLVAVFALLSPAVCMPALAVVASDPVAPGTTAPGPAAAGTLTLATWNLEWLVSQATQLSARTLCRNGATARLPCDVALDLARSSGDYAVLARYARQLDADVVALQEVEDATTAALLFKGYDFCFTGRGDPQNVGFAIRKGIPHRCAPDLLSLSLRDSVRRGAQLQLYPGSPREIWLLSIHLKSGCAREALGSSRAACRSLTRQVPALAAWIDTQVAAGRRFAVLGDFNRTLDADADERLDGGLWRRLADGQPADERLVDTAAGTPFVNCHVGQTFTGYIDYIVLGGGLAEQWQPAQIRRQVYSSRDAQRYRLSDHCPVTLRLRG